GGSPPVRAGSVEAGITRSTDDLRRVVVGDRSPGRAITSGRGRIARDDVRLRRPRRAATSS
ncbi:MAG TPA: hypothetical protein VMU34_10480, partial [Mycobacterium sp.]|nr:hypothetical protein [Mycobacterium sp.]